MNSSDREEIAARIRAWGLQLDALTAGWQHMLALLATEQTAMERNNETLWASTLAQKQRLRQQLARQVAEARWMRETIPLYALRFEEGPRLLEELYEAEQVERKLAALREARAAYMQASQRLRGQSDRYLNRYGLSQRG
ncbi:MAG: hypothetical protein IMW91_00095 [Firmicutes bacterium]|nr:hypothetical protein [Bacillota bacterium]